jgi:NTP pyrophosphatase (non-canonical NTP hydrolase)/very-short-patch-repair endonuclease
MFVCECGGHKSIRVRDVTNGKTSSCGQCNVKELQWWDSKKFGKLKIKNPKLLNASSKKKEIFICDCGKEKSICVYDVTTGKTTSCNMCNNMDSEWWLKQKFGRLKLECAKTLNKCTERKESFICDCGNKKKISVASVTSGRSRSCGCCAQTVRCWYNENREKIRALVAPINPDEFPSGGPMPLERITKNSICFRALCPVCKNVYHPSISRLKSGAGLTCGCSAYQISTPCYKIFDFLTENGYSVTLEYVLSGYKYDIMVAESKVLIEFNGHLYHESDKVKKRDLKKKFLAEVQGFKFITLNDKDWYKDKNAVLQQLLSELNARKQLSHNYHTKTELASRLDEVNNLLDMEGHTVQVKAFLENRKNSLIKEFKHSYEDIITAAINSHHVICQVKNMKPDEAYGNDPFTYYALGLVGEAGELAGALIRAIRNGNTIEAKKAAVESEIADCLIYAIILAYTTGIDLVKVVNEKTKIVETRALAGYYGGPLHLLK